MAVAREYETLACGKDFSTNSDIISSYGRGAFPDPWFDYATLDLPRTMSDVLRYGTRLWYANGIYRSAMERIASFFITELEYVADDDSDRDKYKNYFDKINYKTILGLLAYEYTALNNCFSSVSVPFRRFLVCPACKSRFPISKVDYTWTGDFEFQGKCNACRKHVTFKRRDLRVEGDDDELVFHIWNPLQMFIEYNRYSNKREFYYQIPSQDVAAIRGGKRIMLEHTPWELVETAKQSGQNKLFRFHDDAMFFMSDPPLSTMDSSGWGMPKFLPVARQAFMSQMLHRGNEALVMDYIVPKRFLCPDTASPMDAAQAVSLGMMRQQVLGMMANHRKDPAAVDFMPLPLRQVTVGGEGQQLVTHEMLTASNTEILDSIGIPGELHRGNLAVQAAPLAIRLFQQMFDHIYSQLNGWCQWTANKISKLKNWPRIEVYLRPSTIADDVERKQILLQLASAQKVSDTTALSLLDIDPEREEDRMRSELRRRTEAEREQAKEDAKTQEMDALVEQFSQQAQAMQPGGAPPGGMPPMGGMPPGGGGGAMSSVPTSSQGALSVQDLLAQAEQQAQQLLGLDETTRRRELRALKQNDEYMHALVNSKIEDLRSMARTDGANMLLQGGGGM